MNSTNVPSILPLEATLETLIPGYSLFAHLISFYFDINVLSYIIVLAASLAFWRYAVPAFWDRLQSFLLLFAASAEIRYHNDLYNDTMR